MNDLRLIQEKIIAFRNERDWAQFHDPKNIAKNLDEVMKYIKAKRAIY